MILLRPPNQARRPLKFVLEVAGQKHTTDRVSQFLHKTWAAMSTKALTSLDSDQAMDPTRIDKSQTARFRTCIYFRALG